MPRQSDNFLIGDSASAPLRERAIHYPKNQSHSFRQPR